MADLAKRFDEIVRRVPVILDDQQSHRFHRNFPGEVPGRTSRSSQKLI
jgi:hypothetical protein